MSLSLFLIIMEKDKYFISTAIDYINAAPHLGHALEKIQADVLARYQRKQGQKVCFVSGTDENGLKIVQAAEKQGLKVEKFTEAKSQEFKNLQKVLNLSYDSFVRTSSLENKEATEKFWKKIKKDIYKKKYEGLYCVGCEAFLKKEALVKGQCPVHHTPPQLVKEENYFLNLSQYKKKLKKMIEEEELKIVPGTYKQQALSFLEEDIEDMCISRSAGRAHDWGLDVPGDPSQKIWCWFDALISYLTAIGYGQDSKKFQDRWGADVQKIHFIGKDILKFHVIYWPVMLLAAGLPLPSIIYIHSFLTIQGGKMSKSHGEVVNPESLVKQYSTDALRYFLLREVSLKKDGDFSAKRFKERYQDDLANGLGNLVSRIISLPKPMEEDSSLVNVEAESALEEVGKKYDRAMSNFHFREALISVWELMAFCDQYIDQEEPWQEKRKNSEEVISDLRLILGNIADFLEPFLPETVEKIRVQLQGRMGKSILFPRFK